MYLFLIHKNINKKRFFQFVHRLGSIPLELAKKNTTNEFEHRGELHFAYTSKNMTDNATGKNQLIKA